MAKLTDLLEEALEAWSYTRSGVVEEVENLSEKDLDFRPNEEARSAAELALHIGESGLLMSGELSRPDGDFRRKGYVALLREHGRGMGRARSRKDLIGMLRR